MVVVWVGSHVCFKICKLTNLQGRHGWVPYSLPSVYSGVESGWAGGLRLSSSLPRVRVTRVRAFSLSVLAGPVERAASACLPAVGLGVDT